MSALPDTTPQPRPAAGTDRHRPPPPLRLVPPRSRASRVGLLLTLVIGGVLTVVALQAQAASAAFEARALEGEVEDLQRRHEQLIAEVAELQAPDRLRRIATEDLGMVPATQAAYLDLNGPGVFASARAGVLADPVKQVRTDG